MQPETRCVQKLISRRTSGPDELAGVLHSTAINSNQGIFFTCHARWQGSSRIMPRGPIVAVCGLSVISAWWTRLTGIMPTIGPTVDAHTHVFCWGENPSDGYLSERTR